MLRGMCCPEPEGLFLQTSWTVIASLQAGDAERTAALEHLCTHYRQPLLAYTRGCGLSPHDAEDVVQEFLAAAVRRDIFARADHTRGRLRTFLLAGLRQQMADWKRRQGARKRGGESRPVAPEETAGGTPAWHGVDERSPDKLFARKWVQTLCEDVQGEMRRKWMRSNRTALFDALAPFLTDPLALPQKQALAAQLGVSPGNVGVMLHRFRREFTLAVRRAVAETVASPEEVDDELRDLGWGFLE